MTHKQQVKDKQEIFLLTIDFINNRLISIKNEIDSLKTNETFELVPRPKDKQVVGGKWVYNVKDLDDGSQKFKARYVARGFSQVHGINYDETFSPTVNICFEASFTTNFNSWCRAKFDDGVSLTWTQQNQTTEIGYRNHRNH